MPLGAISRPIGQQLYKVSQQQYLSGGACEYQSNKVEYQSKRLPVQLNNGDRVLMCIHSSHTEQAAYVRRQRPSILLPLFAALH
jgi:hypothetical protein